MSDDASEFICGVRITSELAPRFSSEVRRPEFGDRRMFVPFHRFEQFECMHGLSRIDCGRGRDYRQEHMCGEDRLRKAACQLA